MEAKRTTTTKDINLLQQLYKSGQLVLAPEYQRNSVWPDQAKAYLIDTILADKPIPLLFFQRGRDLQTGRNIYSIIDGQQRLRAIFDFLEDRFALTQSDKRKPYAGKRFSMLEERFQNQISSYDLIVAEIHGYSDADIRDMFVRMNKYVVRLSPQELRNAKDQGAFHDFIRKLASHDFWKAQKVFSPAQFRRMRSTEFVAELVVLLAEGPQAKKAAVDLYYGEYKEKFPATNDIEHRLMRDLNWIIAVLPNFSRTRYHRLVDLYALIAAIDSSWPHVYKLDRNVVRTSLEAFELDLASKSPSEMASTYLAASTKHTNDIGPRKARIDILRKVIIGN
jgi:hypothetical protein